MELTGDYLIPAPRAAVWQALNEPEVLRACVAGCVEVVRVSETRFEGRVHGQIGPMKMRFGGRVELEEVDPPYGHVLALEAGGGGAGVIKARAQIRMADLDGMTRLTYVAQLITGGAIGQLAPGLLQAEVATLAQGFFIRLSEHLTRQIGDVAESMLSGDIDPAILQAAATPPRLTLVDAPASRPVEPAVQPLGHDGPALAPTVWIPALVCLVGLLLFVVTR